MRKSGRTPGSLINTAIRFGAWASAQPKPPTLQEVQGFLDCTYGKARYWRHVYLRSLPLPTFPAGGKQQASTPVSSAKDTAP